MKEFIITALIVAAALFFLVRHVYRIFSGKGSPCSCGTHNYTVKDGKIVEGQGSCCGCCKNCSSKQNV